MLDDITTNKDMWPFDLHKHNYTYLLEKLWLWVKLQRF